MSVNQELSDAPSKTNPTDRRMTDDERAAARAEYDALPGTKPDGYSFVPSAEFGDDPMAAMRERWQRWAADGMTFWRLTSVEDGAWLEVWKERPYKQAPFDPPYSAAGSVNQ